MVRPSRTRRTREARAALTRWWVRASAAAATVQIIFNMLRTKPARDFLPAAHAKDVGTLIRLPLASGLLSGKVDAAYVDALDAGDHRKFNGAHH